MLKFQCATCLRQFVEEVDAITCPCDCWPNEGWTEKEMKDLDEAYEKGQVGYAYHPETLDATLAYYDPATLDEALELVEAYGGDSTKLPFGVE
jgi:hypothetical protein